MSLRGDSPFPTVNFGSDPISALLARRSETGAIAPIGQMQTVADPAFVWGAGGSQRTPEQIAMDREIAASMMQSDYSPVQNVWQGLGRVADNWLGAFDARSLDKEAREAKGSADAQIASALGPANKDIAALLASGNRTAMGLADNLYAARTPKQAAPHFWETNDGSLGRIGANGLPEIVYKDPTPKITWIQADNGDGTKQLIPVGPNGPQMGGGGQFSAQPGANAPAGSPLAGAPNSKVIQGPNGPMQVWNVGGEWYDNPEGL